MYLKRQKVPKTWPIERKGTTYVVRPNSNIEKGIPILVVIRDMLKIAQNRKEVRKAIHSQQVLLNNKKVKDEKNTVLLFDLITILSKDRKTEKKYRLELSENRKFIVVDVPEETDKKTSKIINKKILKSKKIQINLNDGRNIISDKDCNINDSLLIDLKSNKIEKCLPLKEGGHIIVFEGKYLGRKGIIREINSKNKIAIIESDKGQINVLIKQLMVVEK